MSTEPPLPHTRRGLRFLLVGAWNTVFGYLIFLACLALSEALGLHYLWSLPLAHVLAVSQAYYGHRRFVFPDGARGPMAFLRYNTVYAGLFVLNLGLLPALVEGAGLPPWLAQLFIVALTVACSYVWHLRVSFQIKPPQADP